MTREMLQTDLFFKIERNVASLDSSFAVLVACGLLQRALYLGEILTKAD